MIKPFLAGVLVTLLAAGVAFYVIIATGSIPAGADSGPLPLEHWAARTSLRATLASESPKGPNPVALTDANLIAGIRLFGEHCAICHGTAAGNASASPVARGEYPRPPQLATDGVEDDPEGWTYWKIDHGIRWTGMPSWKDTLSDQQMWTLALFLKHMDHLSPAAAQAWQQVTNSPPSGGETSTPGLAPPAQPSTPAGPPTAQPPTG
jgi:thiosulfate dehydrogenase